MKTMPILLDPTAEDFPKNVENLMKTLEYLSKAGILTKIEIAYDESRNHAVLSEFKKNSLPIFDDKDLQL
jgi:hypothetical protein